MSEDAYRGDLNKMLKRDHIDHLNDEINSLNKEVVKLEDLIEEMLAIHDNTYDGEAMSQELFEWFEKANSIIKHNNTPH